MAKKIKKGFPEKVQFFISVKQKEWLEYKAIEQTRKLGKEVSQAMVIRALFQQQIDRDEETKKVWDAQLQISSAI